MSEDNSSKRLLGKVKHRLLGELSQNVERLSAEIDVLNSDQKELLLLIRNLETKINNSRYIKLSETEIIAKIFSGAKMYLDPKDIALVPHLILDGEWEHDITQCWLSLVKAGDTVFDIGANFGYFGILAAQQTNRNASIILFEANPGLIPYIDKSLQVNSFEECSRVENLAIADKSGVVKLNVLKDYLASSSLLEKKELTGFNKMEIEVESSVKVPSITIDEYCDKKGIKSIDIIKMDIEGYEEKAYQGMQNIVSVSPKLILLVEFTKNAYEHPADFYKTMLKDFGHVYLIDSTGKLKKPKNNNYESIIGDNAGWAMLVFSKKILSI